MSSFFYHKYKFLYQREEFNFPGKIHNTRGNRTKKVTLAGPFFI